ncbi:hypothetical protein [Paracoccus sp. SM22M-07]|uniref:hypothetical protein n=1 Tax=Paracoccus sp. SM22M-07 TaxID=1520813 RepID=UPI00091B0CC2|nr:hypothetical protein [Paracoccus sp. SM22M-07]OJH46182.1 hypothetical protein IE00_02960 [Paracoccus sp. SM22M-07]
MNSIKTIAPILITKTRSFWLGIVPAVLTLIDIIVGAVSDGTAEPIAASIAAIFGPVFGVTAAEVHAFMLAVAPLCALIVAHQRSGLARPYTTSPSKERDLVRTIEDGKSAFEAGKAFGERLLQSGSRSPASITTSAPPPRSK